MQDISAASFLSHLLRKAAFALGRPACIDSIPEITCYMQHHGHALKMNIYLLIDL